MKRNIIAFTGPHGTGKTTAVYQMAADLKLQGNASVGVILETARCCPYPVLSKDVQKPSVEAQLWIFSKQMQEEMRMSDAYDIVVSDRTVLDCIAYASVAGMHEVAYAMREMARHYAPKVYETVYFRSRINHDYCKDDGFRNLNPDFRKNVEWALLDLYAEMGIKLTYGH